MMDTSESDGSPAPRLEAKVESATELSPCTEKKISTIWRAFVPVGKIEIEDLKLCYESSGSLHRAFIRRCDIDQLCKDRFGPAIPVLRTRAAAGEPENVEKIGHAYRSKSGKALVITTIESEGDLTVLWSRCLRVNKGILRSAPVSRMKTEIVERQDPAAAPAGPDINAGSLRGS